MLKKRNFNILIIFILITVGAYFIYNLIICENITYSLEDISGDRSNLSNVAISNNIFISKYDYRKHIITKDKVEIEKGSFDSARGMDYKDIDYKEFYLGKHIDASRKSENSNYLFHAEVNYKNEGSNNSLDIRIMDKKKKAIKDIKLLLEDNVSGFTRGVYVLDNNEGIVIVQENHKDGDCSKIYSFNLETGEKINETTIKRDVNQEAKKIDDEYIALVASSNKSSNKDEKDQLLLYNIKEKNIKTIDLKDIDGQGLFVVGTFENLNLLARNNNIYKVNINSNSVELKGTIAFLGERITDAIILDNKLYVANTSGKWDISNRFINVYDTSNMKSLYAGEIKGKGDRGESCNNFELSIVK